MAIIFISRGTVSGVQALLRRLQERIGFRCLSREDLVKQVTCYGDWANILVEQLSEAASSYDHFSRVRRSYIVLMRQALLQNIRDDNVIYHGFSGHLLVPWLTHFVRIRCNAPLALRIPMTMERLNCNEEKARQYIRESDDQQVRWARFMYGRDIRNPGLYDLNINLGHRTLQTMCNILERILLEKDLQATDGLRSQVEDLLLAANVEAALVTDPRTRELEIEARQENGYIHLIGSYLDESDQAVVMETASKVDGVRGVKFIPGYASQHRLEEHQEDLVFQH